MRGIKRLALLALAFAPGLASAANYYVTNGDDPAGGGLLGGGPSCTAEQTTGTNCTLRAAITASQLATAPAVNTIHIRVEGVRLNSALPTITKSLTVRADMQGASAGTLVHVARVAGDTPADSTAQFCYAASSNATTDYNLFTVNASGTTPISVVFDGLIGCFGSITTGRGGAISFSGTAASFLTLNNVRLISNLAPRGGALAISGAAHSVAIRDSVVSGNQAVNGAGIDIESSATSGAVLNIIATTIGPWFATGAPLPATAPSPKLPRFAGGNFANNAGGGLAVNNARLILERSFVVGNTAPTGAAMNLTGARASTLVGNTIGRNQPTDMAGVAILGASPGTLPASDANPFVGNIVADNNGRNGCSAAIGDTVANTGGYNLFSDASCVTVVGPGTPKLPENLLNTSTPIFWSDDAGYITPGGIGGFATRGVLPTVLPLVSNLDNVEISPIDKVRSDKILANNRQLDARNAPMADGDTDGETLRDIGAYEFGALGLVGFIPEAAGGFSITEPAPDAGDEIARVAVANYAQPLNPVTVSVRTIDISQNAQPAPIEPGTALPDVPSVQRDYAPNAGNTITALNGGSQDISTQVAIHADGEFELNETIKLLVSGLVDVDADVLATEGDTLFCPGGSRFYPCATETLTIINAELSGFQFELATVPALAEPAGTANATVNYKVVRRGNNDTTTAFVTCFAEAGTAVAGQDYLVTEQILEFGPGVTERFCAVNVLGDPVVESDETLTLKLKNPSVGELLSPSQIPLTIAANDAALSTNSVLRFEQGSYQAAETAGSVRVTVRREGSSASAISVRVVTQSGSAVAGGDFTGVSQVVEWAAGDLTSKSVDVPLIDNALADGNRVFRVLLREPSPATGGANDTLIATPEAATVTIIDDEATVQPLIGISKTELTVREGGASDSYLVSLASQPSATVTVAVSTDAAVSASPSTLTFTPGDFAARTVVVSAVDNAVVDSASRVVSLRNTASSTDSRYNGQERVLQATVLDNDNAVALSAGNFAVSEVTGTLNVAVRRSGALFGTSQVRFATGGGNATANTDYTQVDTTVFFANGESEKIVPIAIAADGLVEGNETFGITLSAPVGGSGGTTQLGTPASAFATILDGDVPAIVLNPNNLALAEGGGASFKVSLARAPTQNVTVNLSAATGLSVAPASVTFTPASFAVEQTVQVSAAQDSIAQGDRTLQVSAQSVSSDGNFSGLTGAVAVSVEDDDLGQAVFSVSPATITMAHTEVGSYILRIGTAPTANVTINIVAGAGLTVQPTSVVFTPGDTNLQREIQVFSASEPAAGTSVNRNVLHTVTTSDPVYVNRVVPNVNVQVAGPAPVDDGEIGRQSGGALGGSLLLILGGAALLARRRRV